MWSPGMSAGTLPDAGVMGSVATQYECWNSPRRSQGQCGHPVWVLGIKSWSSEKAGSTLNSPVFSHTDRQIIFKIIIVY